MKKQLNFDLRGAFPSIEGKTIDILARSIRREGGRLWMVGGAVRDALLGKKAPDLDAEVYGLDPSKLDRILRSIAPSYLVGRSFAVWKMKGLSLDVSLPRRERQTGLRHQDFQIEADPFLSLDEAARRRDFTINALLWDPLTDELADPTGGLEDLARGILRHTSEQFAEDPLRVLRAMQFVARFELKVAPETSTLCRQLTPEHLPAERLLDEWRKLIVSGVRPSLGLRFLRDVGWLRFFPELEALIDCPQDPEWHPEGDVWEHTLHCLDAFARSRTGDPREDFIVGLAVLCHDMGKPLTTEFSEGRWRSPLHEAAGEAPARSFLQRLTRESSLTEDVVTLVITHMRPHQLFTGGAGDAAVRRLAARVGRIDRLIRVAQADACGRPPIEVRHFPAGQWLKDKAEALAVTDSQPEPVIKGRHLLSLGMEPGPAIGRLTQELYERQLDGEFHDLEAGLTLAREILKTSRS